MEPTINTVVNVRLNDKNTVKSVKVLHHKPTHGLFLGIATDGSVMVAGHANKPRVNGSFQIDCFCPLGANAYTPKSAAKALGFTGKIALT